MYNGSLRILNIHDGIADAIEGAHERQIWALAVHPDGMMVSGSDDKTAKIWRLPAGIDPDALCPAMGLALTSDAGPVPKGMMN